MPIRNSPFLLVVPQAKGKVMIVPGQGRPMLWIRVSNPKLPKSPQVVTLAIVDTGADDCLFPADTAVAVGHVLKSVLPKTISGINSATVAYPHTSRIEILATLANGGPSTNALYTIKNTLVDFMESGNNQKVPFLLGTKSFLSKFVVTIDYPNSRFSIRRPKAKKSTKTKKTP